MKIRRKVGFFVVEKFPELVGDYLSLLGYSVW